MWQVANRPITYNMSTSSEYFINNGRTMAAFIERGTCSCVIDSLIISVSIGVSTSMHLVNIHECRRSRAHVFFSVICDTSFTSHVRHPSNVSLYNTDSVIVMLADSH